MDVVAPVHGSVWLTRLWRSPASLDPSLLRPLEWVQNVCLTIAGLIAGVILCAWLFPGLASMLFSGWALMKANTALLTLLCVSSLVFSRLRRESSSSRRKIVSQVLAAIVVLIAVIVLAEYLSGISLGIDTLLAADKGSPVPGRMSPQTASAFVLLGVILIFIRAADSVGAVAVDFLVFCLCPLMMVIVSGYVFGVMRFFGVSPSTRTAPHTLIVLLLLCLVAFSRRTETGFYSILTGTGIGSRTARFAAPLAIILPFVLETVRFRFSQWDILPEQYATASVTALAAVLGFTLVLVLAWQIERLEQEIRDLSLRDDLTQIYNRRGFFLLAERELRLARRSLVPFSVIFLDLDGLKHVNDTLGHEAGSDFLKEAAALIQSCFRDVDVIGRIGGDEFVVALVANREGMAQSLLRLQQAAVDRNEHAGYQYSFSYSVGTATLDEASPESLEALIKRADEAMYAVKQSKRQGRR
jgi:diguanylate cyclase (GGDEF)-like protein